MNKVTFLYLVLIVNVTCVFAQSNPRNVETNWTTDTSKHVVPLDEFMVLLAPDGIPPIDKPRYWNRDTAEKVLFVHEPVIAVEINGEAKAFPLSILTYHEIVNDNIGGIPVTVTYCPLCNAAIVFDRRLRHNEKDYLLDFGVSGMLRNSDLVMWDRQTQSWWQQFTGSGLVGELAGAQLEFLPSMLISLEEYFTAYPDGMVLSTETGHERRYGTNPYSGYDNLENTQPRLFFNKVDNRLPPMERVIDVYINGKYKIYPLTKISERRVINDTFQGQSLVIFYTSKTVSVLDSTKISESRKVGSVTVFRPEVGGGNLKFVKKSKGFMDKQTKSVWTITGKCISGELEGKQLQPVTHGNHFAFAWFAFHPDCAIYGKSGSPE